MLKGVLIAMVILLPLGLLIYGGYHNWEVELKYQRDVQQFFEYADRSSDAVTKAKFFDQYIDALERNGLTYGTNSVFFTDQPNSNVTNNYIVAQSLSTRLHELSKLNQSEMSYQLGMQQITLQEFCWFPSDSFYQRYALDHGAWGDAIFPPSVSNHCVSTK